MYSILYVDDEPELLEIGQTFLQKYWNLTVTTVTSAEEALQRLEISPYDIIVSDYQMPEMDGITFLKTLRNSHFLEPFILFTGRGREEIVIEALNNGADFYLQKGGHPKAQYAELANMIQKAVEKRRADIEIIRINYQSKAIINHLPDPTFVIDANRRIISWNQALEMTTGYSETELLGKNLVEYSQIIFGIPSLSIADHILNPDIPIQKWYDNVHYEGTTITAETWLGFGTEEKRRIWIKASPLYDESQNIIGAIETLRDITLIRQNEQVLLQKTHSLHETRKQLQNIIDFIPNPTFAIDKYGTVIAWNRAIERMTKKDAISILGKGDHAYAEPFYSERRPTLIDFALNEYPDLCHTYDFIKNEQEHLVAEIYNDKIYGGQGAYLWAVVAPLYDTQGNVTGAIESIRDITAKKELELELTKKYEELASSYEEIAAQNEDIRASFDEIDKQKVLLGKSERQFRSFIEHLPDGVIIHQDKKISYVNPMACQILGYEDPIGLLGIHSLDIVHSKCRDKITNRIIHAGTTNHPFIEEIFLRNDGTDIPVEVAGIKILIGESVSVMTIFRDITQEFERKKSLLQAQNKLKILASITRHDIKNELSAVMAILEVVSLGDIPEREAGLLKRALNPCTNILEQLQTTFEYQTIGIQEPGWFSLRSLCNSAARHHQIDSDVYSFIGEDTHVFADPLIVKVFENLIDNSIRHGKTIHKICFNVERVLDELQVVYEDDGVGIAEADKNRIFEEGFGKNTGLGLFLIKEILAMTRITIQECGELGKGVRFEMFIPHGKWRN